MKIIFALDGAHARSACGHRQYATVLVLVTDTLVAVNQRAVFGIVEHAREQAIVGRHEQVLIVLDDQDVPFRADTPNRVEVDLGRQILILVLDDLPAGIIPISHTQDTAGPMARTVADAAALLTAMAGIDPADDATTAAETKAAVS